MHFQTILIPPLWQMHFSTFLQIKLNASESSSHQRLNPIRSSIRFQLHPLCKASISPRSRKLQNLCLPHQIRNRTGRHNNRSLKRMLWSTRPDHHHADQLFIGSLTVSGIKLTTCLISSGIRSHWIRKLQRAICKCYPCFAPPPIFQPVSTNQYFSPPQCSMMFCFNFQKCPSARFVEKALTSSKISG